MHSSVPQGCCRDRHPTTRGNTQAQTCRRASSHPDHPLRGSTPRNLKGNRSYGARRNIHTGAHCSRGEHGGGRTRGLRPCTVMLSDTERSQGSSIMVSMVGNGRLEKRRLFFYTLLPMTYHQPPFATEEERCDRKTQGPPGQQTPSPTAYLSPVEPPRFSGLPPRKKLLLAPPVRAGAGPTGQAEPGVDKARPEPGHTRVRHSARPGFTAECR